MAECEYKENIDKLIIDQHKTIRSEEKRIQLILSKTKLIIMLTEQLDRLWKIYDIHL